MATGVMTLVGCQTAVKQPSVTYIDRAYTGILPCADCSELRPLYWLTKMVHT